MTLTTGVGDPVALRADDWEPGPGFLQPLGTWFATNRLFTGVLLIATVIRLLVELAYAPALEFFGDSYDYMQEAGHLSRVDIWHPPGYPVLLWVLSATHSVAMVTIVQHAIGIVTGIVIYQLVRRHGVGAMGATLATLPVLLDAYQLDVEQIVLSETVFIALVLLALRSCLKLRRGEGGMGAACAAGLLLSGATLTRTVGMGVAALVLLWLLVTRVGITRVIAVGVAFAVPVLSYALAFKSTYGVMGLQGYSGRYLYGMVGQFANCQGVSLTKQERILCPTEPTHQRPGLNQYVWDASQFPVLRGPEVHRSQTAGSFGRKIVLHQLGSYVDVVASNFVHYFAPGRSVGPRDWFVGSWQFPANAGSPAWHIQPATVTFGGDRKPLGAHIDTGLASFLRGYQRWFYTPGPLLVLLLPLPVLALLARRRDGPDVDAALLLAALGLMLLLIPSASAGFDWRYLLPAATLIVPGGVIAAGVLRRLLAERDWWRFARPAGIVAAIAAIGLGVAPTSGYAAASLTPHHVAQAPATAAIGNRLTINVQQPHVAETQCIATTHGFRMSALVAFPTTVTYKSGSQLLVQPSNFAVGDQDAVDTPRVDGERVHDSLPTVLMDGRHRVNTGQVYVPVTSTTGRLVYVDPVGAGATAWSFTVKTSELLGDVLGTQCTRETAWSGLRVRVLKITGVPLFSTARDLDFRYGLTLKPGRAATFDVRWLQQAPGADPGPWQYPKSWHKTSSHDEQLVNMLPGYTYCVSVRARDIADAATAWTAPSCTTRMYDDTQLSAGPEWFHQTNQQNFYYGTYAYAGQQGATLSGLASFARLAVVTFRCTTCGVLNIYIGGQLADSLDLSTGTEGPYTWLSRPFPKRTTTFELKLGSNGKVVVIDAVGLEP
jgi:hypothetical protein